MSGNNGNGTNGKRKFLWKNRWQDLAEVKRYHRMKTMYYRTDLAIHTARVPVIVREIMPIAVSVYPDIDPELTVAISEVHDDHEMVNGDTPSQYKLLMGEDEKFAEKQKEYSAAELLSRAYRNPLLRGHRYFDLAKRSIVKDSREAQLHSFADKLEGFAEAMHEVLAGNLIFIEPMMNYVGQIFAKPQEGFPDLMELFEVNDPENPGKKKPGPLAFPVVQSFAFHQNGHGFAPHTAESIAQDSGIYYYELWKRVTLSMPGGLERLVTQVEFHPQLAS